MIVIHIDSQKDTTFLKRCYEGLDDTIILYNPTKAEVDETLAQHPSDDVMMLGHGSTSGLFSHDWKGYVIDASNVELLKGRNCIGIWCWAKEFGRRYGLKGYFTSMFISNAGEARCYGYKATDKEVFDEVAVFADAVHELVEEGVPYYEWVDCLKRAAHVEKDFVNYNYSAMEYFDGTQKTAKESVWDWPLTTGEDTDLSDVLMDADEEGLMETAFADFMMSYPNVDKDTYELLHDAFSCGWMAKDEYEYEPMSGF